MIKKYIQTPVQEGGVQLIYSADQLTSGDNTNLLDWIASITGLHLSFSEGIIYVEMTSRFYEEYKNKSIEYAVGYDMIPGDWFVFNEETGGAFVVADEEFFDLYRIVN